jgi:hypothetical protein
VRTQLVDGLLAHLLQDGDSLIVAGFFSWVAGIFRGLLTQVAGFLAGILSRVFFPWSNFHVGCSLQNTIRPP